jgi:serine/threonine protein kinase
VAVKILNPGYGGTEISARFRREGRTAASLSHPNIVQVYDAGEGELEGREVSYIVMEYVPGGDLKGAIDTKGPLPGEDVARLGAEIAAGLVRVHEKGVIHRDIKPHNILIDQHGHPKLTDFGIAHALDATQATRTGSYLGTALYSSPEQLQGEKVMPKSGVYSLGVPAKGTLRRHPHSSRQPAHKPGAGCAEPPRCTHQRQGRIPYPRLPPERSRASSDCLEGARGATYRGPGYPECPRRCATDQLLRWAS